MRLCFIFIIISPLIHTNIRTHHDQTTAMLSLSLSSKYYHYSYFYYSSWSVVHACMHTFIH